MGCAEERGPACSKWQDVIMTIAFLKRLYSTLPVIAEELGQPVEPWWRGIMLEHLPPYPRATRLIRLFPVWRKTAGAGSASFRGLRGKGDGLYLLPTITRRTR